MSDQGENVDPKALLDGLAEDADRYFAMAEDALEGATVAVYAAPLSHLGPRERLEARDTYWAVIPHGLQADARRLSDRLVSLMGQISRSVRNAPLASEADLHELAIGAKSMRAALLLRRFRSWDTEVLHDEGIVLGVTPSGQSDEQPQEPSDARQDFAGWIEKTRAILDLVTASSSLGTGNSPVALETARYRPGTAFVMMWMDKSKPDLVDVADTVKAVFALFDIRAVRADDIEHEGLITQRVLDEIKTSEFCFADLSGARPNVYYEVGFAHALGRRVILFRKSGTGIHFDLAGYNCPEYQNLHDLREQLLRRLRVMTNREPRA